MPQDAYMTAVNIIVALDREITQPDIDWDLVGELAEQLRVIASKARGLR